MRLRLIDDEPVCGELVTAAIRHEYPDAVIDQSFRCDQDEMDRIDHAYDAVILDLSLSGQDGLDCLKKVRERWPLMPVVILTGAFREERRQECLNAGADGYVLKTAMMPLLSMTVVEAIEKRRADARAAVSKQATEDFHEGRKEQLLSIQRKLGSQ